MAKSKNSLSSCLFRLLPFSFDFSSFFFRVSFFSLCWFVRSLPGNPNANNATTFVGQEFCINLQGSDIKPEDFNIKIKDSTSKVVRFLLHFFIDSDSFSCFVVLFHLFLSSFLSLYFLFSFFFFLYSNWLFFLGWFAIYCFCDRFWFFSIQILNPWQSR